MRAVAGNEEFAVRIVKREGNIGLGTGMHEGGGGGAIPGKGDDAVEVVQGDAELGFLLVSNRNGRSIFLEVSTLEGDEESIKMSAHAEKGL